MFSVSFLIASICLHTASTEIPVINDGNENQPITHVKYIASLQLVTTNEFFFCAGIFISQTAVLTLASCFYQNDVKLNPEDVRVVGGTSFRLERDLNSYSGILKDIEIHQNFSRSSLEGNIAIGYLSNPIPDSIKTVPIENIALSPPTRGTECEIYGWSITTRFESSPHLLSGEVVIESKEKCDVATNKITSTTLCAGPYFVNGCETDDGSPLVCSDKVYALVDFRPAHYCKEIITDRLGTYVDLSEFHDWITERAASNKVVIKASIILLSTMIMRFLN